MFSRIQILIYRGVGGIAKGRSKGTVNREQGTGMAATALAKAFPRQRSCRFRGRWPSRQLAAVSEVGRGRSPCGIASLRALFKENDLFRLSRTNASIFRESHLPLKRRLRLLGKAFGCVRRYAYCLLPEQQPAKSEYATDHSRITKILRLRSE